MMIRAKNGEIFVLNGSAHLYYRPKPAHGDAPGVYVIQHMSGGLVAPCDKETNVRLLKAIWDGLRSKGHYDVNDFDSTGDS